MVFKTIILMWCRMAFKFVVEWNRPKADGILYDHWSEFGDKPTWKEAVEWARYLTEKERTYMEKGAQVERPLNCRRRFRAVHLAVVHIESFEP